MSVVMAVVAMFVVMTATTIAAAVAMIVVTPDRMTTVAEVVFLPQVVRNGGVRTIRIPVVHPTTDVVMTEGQAIVRDRQDHPATRARPVVVDRPAVAEALHEEADDKSNVIINLSTILLRQSL